MVVVSPWTRPGSVSTNAVSMVSDRREETDVVVGDTNLTALPPLEKFPSPPHSHSDKQSYCAYCPNPFQPHITEVSGRSAFEDDDEEEKSHSRMKFWLCVAIVILIILAVILGAVLGTLANQNDHGSESPLGEPPNPRPTTSDQGPGPPRSPPAISSMAVTSWSVSGSMGYSTIWLFYQNEEGWLSRSTFNSSTGEWTHVAKFVKAKKGSPIAAMAYNSEFYAEDQGFHISGYEREVQLVYLNTNNAISVWTFFDSGAETGVPSPISRDNYTAAPTSHLAAYWPHIVYQPAENTSSLVSLTFNCSQTGENVKNCWRKETLKTTTPKVGTPLAIVPMRDEGTAMGVFYREERKGEGDGKDGRLVCFLEEGGVPQNVWTSRAFLPFSQPSTLNTTITAFSVPRSPLTFSSPNNSVPSSSSNSTDSLSTHILTQYPNSTIYLSSSTDGSGWQAPRTYPAFDNARNATPVACLTGQTFARWGMGSEGGRCYFQINGEEGKKVVRGVEWDGEMERWSVVGNVDVDLKGE